MSRIALVAASLFPGCVRAELPVQSPRPYADPVEIRRTDYGVPHIMADDIAGWGHAMAWVQLEDYGARVAHGFVRARPPRERLRTRISPGNFAFRLSHALAAASFDQLGT